ncbi:MAG TPA: DUF4412 domain-containing protein [Thermoanaerobaculia bacterium]|nr:DUF4412 domain-containing protein [Thermoanaerobaculia bacterium]
MVRRQGLIVAIALTIACQKTEAPKPAAGEPQVRATVVTIRETVGEAPSVRTYTHALMIANNLARSGDEVDTWRLFDLKSRQVTFVDEVTKTYRTAMLDKLTKEHRDAYAKPADGLPVAQWIASNEKKTINGFEAAKATVTMGGYQRELWIAEKSPIPPQLFAFMRASEPAPSPIAGVARAVDEALLKMRGFPMSDHAELPFDNKKLVVDRVVEKIETKDVPASWFQVPRGYRAANK